MAKASIQKKLKRVRPPRVQIEYEVEIGDAMELKELPFVVGALADLSGDPDQPLPALKDRKFVNIDRDNFDNVLEGMAPRLAYRADDKLSGSDDSEINVELRFKSMDDFTPENVVKQIEPLNELLETRNKLKNLLGKMEGNDKLEALLESVLKDTDARAKLSQELGLAGSASSDSAAASSEDAGGSTESTPDTDDTNE